MNRNRTAGLLALWIAPLGISGDARPAFEAWSNAGLDGGDTIFVVYKPGNGSVYAVNPSQGFLRRTTDAGANWIEVTPTGGFYLECAVGPEGEVVVGGTTQGVHVFRSSDHGASWEDLGQAPTGRVTDLRFDPFDRARILLGLNGYGVAEYTHGGPIFNDSFETGDVDRWSQTTP